jgi:hypothetical protein
MWFEKHDYASRFAGPENPRTSWRKDAKNPIYGPEGLSDAPDHWEKK